MKVKSLIHTSIATWFGSGLSPIAPGTMGSLATLPVILLLCINFEIPYLEFHGFIINAFFPLALLIALVSAPSVAWVIRESKNPDPSKVVIDEVAGQTLAFSFLHPACLGDCYWLPLFGFALFRFFDILKPFGIRKLEALPGAVGVISDDLLAGLYAGLILHGVAILFMH